MALLTGRFVILGGLEVALALAKQRAGIPAVLLPYTVGGSDRAKDLFGLYEDTLARLLAVPRAVFLAPRSGVIYPETVYLAP